MIRLRQSFIATVLYADVFDYPLSISEVLTWSSIPMKTLPKIKGIDTSGEFICVYERKHILMLRKKRCHIAKNKWRIARSRATIFRFVPSVLLVGVTGGLAMNNAKKNDDIDLFFIVRSRTLWITRMIVTVLSDLFHIRRRPGDLMVSDKICLNMFMSEEQLVIPKNEQDLFTAHEVLQMQPIWEREGAHHKFLQANFWVKHFLPNAWQQKNQESRIKNQEKQKFSIQYSVFILRVFEPIVRVFQLWYMKRRRTFEVIRSGMIRFHPKDARVWIRKKYKARLKKWNIPLDNIFYHR